ncbi:MAG: hypothetical protein PHV06_11920, partial [bacterium]|nr:hypothetical protein [bacterium]
MKKLLILFISIILFYSLNYGNKFYEKDNQKYNDYLTYTDGQIENQIIRNYPNTIVYNSSGKFIINLSKENLSNDGQVFPCFGFMKGRGMGNDFNLYFEGTNSELVEWRYEHTDFIDIGQIDYYIHPGKILNDECDLNKFIDLSKVGSSVLIVSGEYKLKATRFLKDSTSSGKTEIIGKIYPEPFRLFVNMEGQLLAADIDVNPDKWNLNWFRMANNEGVFTVWIEKLPDNYSVKDIKQETILFNG